MDKLKLSFIGSGNMARSMINGLLDHNYPATLITAANPTWNKLAPLQQDLGINVTTDNIAACQDADIVILAVKPAAMATVCHELAPLVRRNPMLIISVAAGITVAAIERWMAAKIAVVRCMPNLPSSIGSGTTGLYANQHCSITHKNQAEALMRAIGVTVWIEREQDLNLVTAISGCGPAYFFLIMRALEQAAVKYGLAADIAHLLVTQTALGASQIALQSSVPLTELITQVRSPGGTTEKALQVLEESRIMEIFDEAVAAATQRGAEIAQLLGKTS